MISAMCRVEIVGPRDLLWEALRRLQAAGLMQLEKAPVRQGTRPAEPPPAEGAQRAAVGELARALEVLVEELPDGPPDEEGRVRARRDGLEAAPALALVGRADTLVRSSETLAARVRELEAERATLEHHLGILDDLAHLDGCEASVVLPLLVSTDPRERRQVVADIEEICEGLGGGRPRRQRVQAAGRSLEAWVVPGPAAEQVQEYLWLRRVPRVVFPDEYASLPATRMRARMQARRTEVEDQLAEARRDLEAFRTQYRVDLRAVAALLSERGARLAACELAAASDQVFQLVGWVPRDGLPRLREALGSLVEQGVEVHRLRFDPRSLVPPTRLENPWWARPAEVFLSVFPPPRYGGFDPSILLLFTFPALFGWMVGDAGYGAVLLALALGAERRAGARHPYGRDFARVLALGAVFSIGFGVLFGEYFGSLGGYLLTGTWHAPVHLWMHRGGDQLKAYLLVSLGIGLSHLTLSLGLGIVDAGRDLAVGEPHARELLVERIAWLGGLWGAVLAGLGRALPEAGLVAPGRFTTALGHGGMTLAGAALLLLVWSLPGAARVTALFEELSIVSKAVSYARLMAAGVVGVALAEIANSIARSAAGAGPLTAAAAILGAVLTHLLVFVVVIADPLIQALRLHYVESFPLFMRPGGGAFRPLARVPLAEPEA